MSALEKLIEKLISTAYTWSWRMHGRSIKPSNKVIGVPGEVINSLSLEERETLQNLKAEDLSLEKIPRYALETFIDGEIYTDKVYRDEKLKFDKKILR